MRRLDIVICECAQGTHLEQVECESGQYYDADEVDQRIAELESLLAAYTHETSYDQADRGDEETKLS